MRAPPGRKRIAPNDADLAVPRRKVDICKVCFNLSEARPRVGLCRGCGQPYERETIESPSLIGSALGTAI